MSRKGPDPITSGPAFRVTILGPQQAEAYEGVYVHLDPDRPAVHVFSADAQTHYLTIPAGSALVEWQDPAALEPQLRVPPFGAASFERLGAQVERMAEGIGRGFGQV